MDPEANRGDSTRRILSLDGGGIRGMVSLGILERIEAIYRDRRGRPDLVLADEFDLIAGTSTGAIIATCLCWGMSVADVLELYETHGARMFTRSRFWRVMRAKYRAEAIADTFRELLVEADGTEATLGSPRLGALLLVVMRNATTGSAWPLCSNPRATFNDPSRPDCNLRIPLWQLLRASTAAPTFFPPERIRLGDATFTFIDGGVTPYNNPALIALLTATLPEYRLGWPAGADRLLLLSVGTGRSRSRLPRKAVERLNLIDHARYVPPALIGSISEQQDVLCRLLGECVHGEAIDLELGDLRASSLLRPEEKLCTYARYNPPLEASIRLDDVSRLHELVAMGRRYAAEAVQPDALV